MDFENIKKEFARADVREKINLYVNTAGLTQDQYRELLNMFPLSELGKLEAAL